jgi:hypothetical protein
MEQFQIGEALVVTGEYDSGAHLIFCRENAPTDADGRLRYIISTLAFSEATELATTPESAGD